MIKNTYQEFQRNLAFYLYNRSLLNLSVLECTDTVFKIESLNELEVRKNEIMIVYSIHACEVFGHEIVGFKICSKKCMVTNKNAFNLLQYPSTEVKNY